MELQTTVYVVAGVLSAAILFLFVALCAVCGHLKGLKRSVDELLEHPRLRVQKLKVGEDKNHAFHNPTLVPDEELSRRGYTMYRGEEDLESGRGPERQTGGEFVEELTRELEIRHHPTSTPPFLLQAIEDNKRRSRNFGNPTGRGRASDTNPNFIY